MLSVIREIIPNYEFVEDYRPNFLKNEKTGKNLEIDIFCVEKNFGFEYQGAHHFRSIDGSNPDKSREHDYKKIEMIKKRKPGAVIIELFESDLKGDIKQNIINRIIGTSESYPETSLRRYFLKNLALGIQFGDKNGFRFNANGLRFLDENKKNIKMPEECKVIRNKIKAQKKERRKIINAAKEELTKSKINKKELSSEEKRALRIQHARKELEEFNEKRRSKIK